MKSLYESILSKAGVGKMHQIQTWLDEYGIKNYTINDRGAVDVDGDVDLSYKDIEEFPPFIQFGVVKGYFSCSNNKLTSLKGSPKKVNGSFYCQNNKLTSIEGSPREVGDGFYCQSNKLTSLKGAPEKVRGNFVCLHNKTQFTKEDVMKVCKVKREIMV